LFARDTLVVGGGCILEVVLVRVAKLADDEDEDDVDDDGRREEEDALVFVVAKFATGGFTTLSDGREEEVSLVSIFSKTNSCGILNIKFKKTYLD
jgi:hypothetical protein